MSFYHTALTRICKYSDYQNIINFRIKVLDLMRGLSDIKEIKPHSKKLTKYLMNFDYISFMQSLKDILCKNDLIPFYYDMYDESWETIDDMFSYVPYMLVGYYGQYDAYISIDDLSNMTEHERVMAMLFMSQEFCLNEETAYDREKYNKFLEAIQDKVAKHKTTKLINEKADLSKVYQCFCDDYNNEQYRKDKFTDCFLYLFQRIVRDTGCGFIDMLPEEQDNCYSGWEELPGMIEFWREYKTKEKRHNKFIQDLNKDKKLSKRFYQFLFDEVIPRYKE